MSPRALSGESTSNLLELGRPVVEEELASDLLLEIKNQVGSLRRAERLGRSSENDAKLIAAGNARREDLLVYFGLNLFNGRTRYSTLAPELQRDIKIFLEMLRVRLMMGENCCFLLATLG